MPETNKNRLIAIAEAFDGVKGVTNVSQYGMGHINDTYLVETKGKERYILQRINDKIFTDVDKLMQNIVGVTEYISAHTAAPKEECLRVIPTAGKPYLRTEEGCFRTYNFISAGVSIEHVPTAEGLYVSSELSKRRWTGIPPKLCSTAYPIFITPRCGSKSLSPP